MPTLDDAFPTVRDALAERFGEDGVRILRGLDPFEAMVAVLLDREIGGARR